MGYLVALVIAVGSSISLGASTLSLCNRNADRAIYAAQMRQVGAGAGWQAQGWYKVEAGKCLDLNLGEYQGKAYVYALDDKGETEWGDGNVTFCVNKTQPFTHPNADTMKCDTADVKTVHSDEVTVAAGTTVWEAKPNVTKVTLCNQNTTYSLYAAIAKANGTAWRSQGWWELAAGGCKTVSLGKYTGTLYFYAEYNGGALAWGTGPFQFCVNKAAAFDLPHGDVEAECRGADMKMVKASSASVVAGDNKINFQPVSLDTILNLCNETELKLFSAYAIAGGVGYQSTGWLTLTPKTCVQRNLGAYAGKAYLYAEYNGGERYWGTGPVNFCVHRKDAFTIEDSLDAARCNVDVLHKMVPAYELGLGHGTNTLSFKP